MTRRRKAGWAKWCWHAVSMCIKFTISFPGPENINHFSYTLKLCYLNKFINLTPGIKDENQFYFLNLKKPSRNPYNKYVIFHLVINDCSLIYYTGETQQECKPQMHIYMVFYIFSVKHLVNYGCKDYTV